MTPNDRLLVEAIKVTLATYAETRRRTREDMRGALTALKNYLPGLIAGGLEDRTELMLKGLIHLRELEQRPAVVPVWMRRREEIAAVAARQISDRAPTTPR
jgi:hypothetical protein